MSKFKIGDIVSYRNTRGNIKKAEITSFETVDNGKVWFHGIDVDTKASNSPPIAKSIVRYLFIPFKSLQFYVFYPIFDNRKIRWINF